MFHHTCFFFSGALPLSIQKWGLFSLPLIPVGTFVTSVNRMLPKRYYTTSEVWPSKAIRLLLGSLYLEMPFQPPCVPGDISSPGPHLQLASLPDM